MQYADEAYPLRGATPAETYLNIPKIIKASIDTGSEAIHPGYGFLSEDSNFVAACEERHIVFVGPTSRALEKLGDKLLARKTMEDVNVPLIPGSMVQLVDADDATTFAESLGYPVIIKAVYGGGGRGMRVARDSKEVRRFFRITKLESQSSFGKGELYIEKQLTNPRHVEIQAVADQHGKIVTLGERECSIQRRHQKLLEEAPSIALNDELRQQLSDTAKRGLSAAGYTNAGTVEFLLDHSGKYYFLEVNKRLQVEHLVTELTTGFDLVEEQLNIASGMPLSMSQNEVHVKGWAINCRINAEDVRKGFAPSPGTVIQYRPPGGPGIRIDSALYSGLRVPEYYDSMIAKLATWGRNRNEAIHRMRVALDEIEVMGIPTTLVLHRTIMHDPGFVQGEFNTGYLNKILPQINVNLQELQDFAVAAAAMFKLVVPAGRNQVQPTDRGSRWRTYSRTRSVSSDRGMG
jgi:acetyl-CoA carboxylase biotin carboxylase subunit